MKKTLLVGLVLCGVSSIVLAQEAKSPAERIVQMVEQNVLSQDIDYRGKPTVRPVQGGFEVAVPAGITKTNTKSVIPAFSFLMMDDGASQTDPRYQFHLDKSNQIFPTLSKLLVKQKVMYTSVDYIGSFIPSIGLLDSQLITVKNISIPVEGGSSAKADEIKFSDSSTVLGGGKLRQENNLSLTGIQLVYPLAVVSINSFDFNITVPEVQKAKTPMAQFMKTPRFEQRMVLNGVGAETPFTQEKTSFDVTQQMTIVQNQEDYNMDVSFNLGVGNIQSASTSNMVPAEIKADLKSTGFTFDKLLVYFAATRKLNDLRTLPVSAQTDAAIKTVTTEQENARIKLQENMVLDVNEITVRSPLYAVVLKGKFTPKTDIFKGSLQVTNLDVLAPEPKKIDQVVCKAMLDKMLDGTMPQDEFKRSYAASCDEQRGILDFLNPYTSTAQVVKDAEGKTALLFSIEIQNDILFVNGQKANAPWSSDTMAK